MAFLNCIALHCCAAATPPSHATVCVVVREKMKFIVQDGVVTIAPSS